MARRPPVGLHLDWDGPLLRRHRLASGFVDYRNLEGVDDVDALIARNGRLFAERDEAFRVEDAQPRRAADLPDRLRAYGFVAEDARR